MRRPFTMLDYVLLALGVGVLLGWVLLGTAKSQPASCLGRYHGRLQINRIADVAHSCGPGARACSYPLRGRCIIILPRYGNTRALYRHELAHCNCGPWH